MDAGRAHVLSRLAAEKRQATGCFEYERAAELQAQMNVLSQGSASNPAAEKAASPSRNQTAARPSSRKGTRAGTPG